MTIKTKFDLHRERNEIRTERQKNVEQLEAKLERAKALEAVIPFTSDSYEEDLELKEERQFINDTISELEEMIEDEKQAIEQIGMQDYLPTDDVGYGTVEI